MRNLRDIEVQFVKGVGPKRAAVLKEHGIHTVEDLLYTFPRRYLDRSTVKPISQLREGDEATIVCRVYDCRVQRGRKERLVATVGDGSGYLTCVWFQGLTFWKRIIKPGAVFAFHGKVGYFRGLQLVHPDYDRIEEGGEWKTLNTGAIIPLYPSTEKLSAGGFDSRGFRRVLRRAVEDFVEQVQDPLPEDLRRKFDLVDLKTALRDVHFPETLDALEAARRRLKFDELFFLQVVMALRKAYINKLRNTTPIQQVGKRTRKLIDLLPFELTQAQRDTLNEIYQDLKGPHPMNRLVQGDVGSGKTMVAIFALMMAVENGYQAALMAPTEILAEQHYISLHRLVDALGVKILLLYGGLSKKEREAALQQIAAGEVDIVVGTHALIQPDVEYQNLGLVVIDEQHRFGVMQRAALQAKGRRPHVLVMTATPIPRTLAMTVYGDLDVSYIREMPAGRKPVKTVWRPAHKREEVYRYLRQRLLAGEQAYMVFPLVEESEKIDLQAATETFERLRNGVFRDLRVGLLHGRMSPDEKERVMQQFKSGELQLLVSTTVIEVGVDVPNASVMVIDNAERFGLTQLHQLRGRVGRGERESLCILLCETPLSEEAKTRIETLCSTNDGFKIAEVDMQLRGPGELFGTRQHGLPEFRMADFVHDAELLEMARNEVLRLAEQDMPGLIEIARRGRSFKLIERYFERLEFANFS